MYFHTHTHTQLTGLDIEVGLGFLFAVFGGSFSVEPRRMHNSGSITAWYNIWMSGIDNDY